MWFEARSNFSAVLPSDCLGLLNVQSNGNASNRLLAVVLDTMKDAEFRDMNHNHVGVHSVQSYYEDGTSESCNMTMIRCEALWIWVDYNTEATQINVTMASQNMAKPARPLVSARTNLSTVLTDSASVRFSAATGGMLKSRHYVLGWSFGMDCPAPAIDISKLPKLPRVGASTGQGSCRSSRHCSLPPCRRHGHVPTGEEALEVR